MTYANSADWDQTAPEGAVWSRSTLFAIPLSILSNRCIKKQSLGQNNMEQSVQDIYCTKPDSWLYFL